MPAVLILSSTRRPPHTCGRGVEDESPLTGAVPKCSFLRLLSISAFRVPRKDSLPTESDIQSGASYSIPAKDATTFYTPYGPDLCVNEDNGILTSLVKLARHTTRTKTPTCYPNHRSVNLHTDRRNTIRKANSQDFNALPHGKSFGSRYNFLLSSSPY